MPVVLLLLGVAAVQGTTESDSQLPPLKLPELAEVAGQATPRKEGHVRVPKISRDGTATSPTPTEKPSSATRQTVKLPAETPAPTSMDSLDAAEETTASSAGQDAADDGRATEPVTVSRLIVSAGPFTPAPTERVVATVEEAIRTAAQDPNISEVVLAFTGRREVSLIEAHLDPAGGHVLVTAGEGHQPELHFDPMSETLKSQIKRQNPAMITLVGGRMTWRDIDFVFKLPDSPFERASWALFRIDHVVSANFTQCRITVQNADTYGLINSDVSVFDFAGNMSTKLMLDQENEVSFENAVVLGSSVVRGETALLRCHEGAPFSFEWDNGVLITSEQLLTAEGSAAMALNDQNAMSVRLSRVTAVVDKPLCEVNWQNATKPLKLIVDLEDSLIRCNATDEILIQTEGSSSLASAEELMQYTSRQSCLQTSSICWRAVTDDADVPTDFRFGDSYTQSRPWFTQVDPVTDVTMAQSEFDRSPIKHTQSPEQYRLATTSRHKPGCRFDLLRSTPATPVLKPAGATTPTPSSD